MPLFLQRPHPLQPTQQEVEPPHLPHFLAAPARLPAHHELPLLLFATRRW
jgi:hypothetical protein